MGKLQHITCIGCTTVTCLIRDTDGIYTGVCPNCGLHMGQIPYVERKPCATVHRASPLMQPPVTAPIRTPQFAAGHDRPATAPLAAVAGRPSAGGPRGR